MTELLTAAQMKAIEAAAIASGAVTGLELMERAGRGVVEAIFAEWPELAKTAHRAVVLCGPGNNGGDGFVVARLLKEQGWEVEVFLYGEPERMPPDVRVNCERWRGMGAVEDAALLAIMDPTADVYVDALFGIGLTRQIAGDAAIALGELWNSARGHRGRLVAVDVPSGLCADSGRDLVETRGGGAPVDLTVTFAYAKLGHHLAQGPERCEQLVLVDIGLPVNAARKVLGIQYDSVTRRKADYSVIAYLEDGISLRPGFSFSASILDKAFGGFDAHKYAHGHALILSGPPGHGGAARLAARGALRIGAGLVTVACPPDAMPENAARLDAIMLRAVSDGAGLVEVLQDNRINALCLGPGLGLDARAVGLVAAALGLPAGVPPPPSPPHEGEGGRLGLGAALDGNALPLPLVERGQGRGAARPLVLDADALTILSQHPDLFAALHPNCILTPHAGEFARLFPDIAAKLSAPAITGPAYSKVDATREAAARAGCVVLFKGPDTVIADPSGHCSINSAHYGRAAPWLATAGSGDVLAGFITGLLARGFDPMQAAETAAWLHVECARSFGPGLIAEDLPDELPKVFRALGL